MAGLFQRDAPDEAIPARSPSTWRLPAWLALLLGLPLAAGLLLLQHQRAELRRDARAYLSAVANLKATEIAAWLSERRGDVEVASRNLSLSQALELQERGSAELLAGARAQLELIRRTYSYQKAYLIDPAGKVLLGTDDDPAAIGPDTLELARRARRHGGGRLERFWRGGASLPFVDAVAPVFANPDARARIPSSPAAGRFLGSVVLRTEPTSTLWPLVLQWPAASRPFALTLVRPGAAGQVEFFDATRPDDFGGQSRPIGTPRLAEAQALRRKGDLGDAVDVAGMTVLAAAWPIAGADWTVVAKSSLAAIDAPARRLAGFAAGSLAVLIGLGISLGRGYFRRQSERPLRQSEERLRISQALARAGTWDWDEQEGTFAVSDGFWQVMGGSADANPRLAALLARVPREERRTLIRALRSARRGDGPLSLEHGLRRPDGELRVVTHEARRYGDSAGKGARMIGVIVDVTERRAAEQRVRAGEETFKNIVENMQDAFMATEIGGDARIVRANPAAARMLGYASPEQLIGKSMTREITVNLDDREVLRERLMTDGVAREHPSVFRRADGSHVAVEGNVRLIRDGAGRPVMIEGVVRDMSTHHQRQAELTAAREAAVEAAEVKARFLANMSHEIRTPLNAVVGLSHLLVKGELPARQRDYVDKIQSSARMLLEVINGVLDFSKLEAGKLTLDAAGFFLDELLENVANVLAVQAQAKGLELAVALGEGVPVALRGDPLRLGQVLTNLAGNAIKFTDSGEVVVSVERAALGEVATPDGQRGGRVGLRFSVRDSGIGMGPQQIERLFQPFTQADDSASRRFGGTGLGLAICRQLVELMGGRIEIESAPGAGSTFSFTLAFDLRTSSSPQPALADRPFGAGLSGLRVLLVDDHNVSRLVLSRQLREIGCDTSCAGSGAEALRAVAAADQIGRPFGLVLLDWKMPGMDGVETARQVAARAGQHPPPRMILVTAHGDAQMSAAAEAAGITALLQKPVSRSTLLDAVAEAVGLKGVRRFPPAGTDSDDLAALAGALVLVVEDNIINQEVARELLEGVGMRVLIAGNGREACAVVDQVTVDAVMMDLQMPEMDGYEATRVIRRNPRHATLPIIAMTAHTFALERERCRAAGMNDHVAKPVDPPKLFAVLERWLRPAPGSRIE
jgi:two-component system sensor histidine kinase/response regulator